VHVAGADGPHEYSAAGLPRRENDQGVSPFFRLSDRQKTRLRTRILEVGHNQGRRVSENVLHFSDRDAMFLTLRVVALSHANPEKGTFCMYTSV